MIRILIVILALSTSASGQSRAVDVYLQGIDFEELANQQPGKRDVIDLRGLLPERRSNAFLNYLEAKSYRGLLDEIDGARLNKIVEAASGSGGTTALLSRVAVPAVLGFAVEYGGILQQTDGTSTSIRANLLGIGRLALGAEQFPYCAELSQNNCDAASRRLRRVSGSITYDDARKKMASWGVRFDLTSNQLDDPRFVTKWRRQIAKLRGNKPATDLTDMIGKTFGDPKTLSADIYTDWRGETIDLLQKAAGGAEMKVVLEGQLDLLMPILEKTNTDFVDDLKGLRRAYSNYFMVRDALVREAQVHKLSLEYANNHPKDQPSRSSLRLIYSHQPTKAPAVVTVNLAITAYNSGSMRDVQLAGQLDRKLGEVAGFGNATLTMAGYYQWMKDDALIEIGPGTVAPGSGIVLPGKAAKLLGTKGHIGIFQTKLSLPAGKTMKVPISVTWANRTELINEKDVRGQIGLTLDMDSLFRQ